MTRFMAGGDLFNYIVKQPNQPLLEDQTKMIIRQVATGLQALHKRNIIHRDIKVDNMLVASTELETEVRISDLGSAIKLQSADGTSNFQIGTPGYVAPEVLKG